MGPGMGPDMAPAMAKINGKALHLDCSLSFAVKLGAIPASMAPAGAVYMTVTAAGAPLVWEIDPKVAYERGW